MKRKKIFMLSFLIMVSLFNASSNYILNLDNSKVLAVSSLGNITINDLLEKGYSLSTNEYVFEALYNELLDQIVPVNSVMVESVHETIEEFKSSIQEKAQISQTTYEEELESELNLMGFSNLNELYEERINELQHEIAKERRFESYSDYEKHYLLHNSISANKFE